MRIPLLKGRDFTDRDDLQSPLVAVINDTFARRAWPGDDPIGKRFTTPQTPGPPRPVTFPAACPDRL